MPFPLLIPLIMAGAGVASSAIKAGAESAGGGKYRRYNKEEIAKLQALADAGNLGLDERTKRDMRLQGLEPIRTALGQQADLHPSDVSGFSTPGSDYMHQLARMAVQGQAIGEASRKTDQAVRAADAQKEAEQRQELEDRLNLQAGINKEHAAAIGSVPIAGLEGGAQVLSQRELMGSDRELNSDGLLDLYRSDPDWAAYIDSLLSTSAPGNEFTQGRSAGGGY